ncbi:hypothetical protein [Lactococcus lactis]
MTIVANNYYTITNLSDGNTPYWHTAYANSADGRTDFSLSISDGKRYIGQYTDYTSSDSTNPTKYKWVDMIGNISVGGTNLLPNSGNFKDLTGWLNYAYLTSLAIVDNKIVGVAQSTGIPRIANRTLFPLTSIPQEMTISVEYISTGEVGIFSKSSNSLTNFNESGSQVGGTITKNRTTVIDGNRKRTTFNWKTLVATDTILASWIAISIPVSTTTEIVNVQIEKGNIVTSWKPSPEDIDAKIDSMAGKDGVGILTTTITYAGSTSGTTAPTSGWTSTVPTVAAGSYLWTKTVWAYTDNTSETGYSVAKMGDTGPTGPSGVDGAPGKIVSDTEPTTRFKGLTWKYLGITAINASDGTNIQPNTEYYWNGNNWVINLIKAQNINVDTLSAITAVLGDMFGGSLTISKSNTQGIAVKDGVVKSWDISKMTDPNYPDGYSYTSMGVALDSGGLTIYSAGYGHTLDKGGVIDSKYKVASLQAIAGNGRQNSGTGLILEANDSDFPFTVDGNIDVTGVVNQSYKQATVNFGYGRNVTLTRNGNYVTITSQNRYTIAPPNGTWLRNIATLPSGYRPVDDVLIYNHELSNSSKFSWSLLHPSGAIDLFSSGNILTTDYILSSSQCWITNDAMPS